jgi:hypothetical protein
VRLADGVAVLDAYAELPALLTSPGSSPIRVAVTIRAKPDGSMKLDGIRLHAGQAYLGALKVKDLDLLYDGGLTVSGKLLFPPVDAGIDIKEFRIDNRGAFRSLILDYLAGAGTGIPVGPGVFLTKVGGGLSLDPDEIHADAAVSVGPSATGGGCPAVGGDGQLILHFGPAPFWISTHADMQIVCLSLAQVDFFARQDGFVTLGASMGFDAGPLYFNAGVKGSLFLPNWQVEGSGDGGIRKVLSGSVHVIISNRGFAGCGSVDLGFLGDISGGAGVRYNPTLLLGPAAILSNLRLFVGCDLSDWKTVVAAPASAQAEGSKVVRVVRGEKALAVAVDGDTAAPKVVLRGPDGTVIDVSGEAESAKVKNGLGARSDEERRTFFLVGKPATGRWTIEPATGSARIIKVLRSQVLPKPKVAVKVRGRGAKRVLSWNVARRAGQIVRFVEQADQGGQVIATVKGGGRGSKKFIVAEARGPKRQIVAQVEQGGLPRDNIVAATFSASSPKVGRAKVKVRRKGKGAVVAWSPAFYATHYDVIVERSTGARSVLSPIGKKRQLAIAGLGKAGVVVKVVGISKNDVRGPAVTARLAAQKPKAKRRRR